MASAPTVTDVLGVVGWGVISLVVDTVEVVVGLVVVVVVDVVLDDVVPVVDVVDRILTLVANTVL